MQGGMMGRKKGGTNKEKELKGTMTFHDKAGFNEEELKKKVADNDLKEQEAKKKLDDLRY